MNETRLEKIQWKSIGIVYKDIRRVSAKAVIESGKEGILLEDISLVELTRLNGRRRNQKWVLEFLDDGIDLGIIKSRKTK